MVASCGLFVVASGCGSSGNEPPKAEVSAAEAYTAVVRWEVSERPAVVDADGEVELPLIYLSAESGETIDIGVQADVVEATVDEVVVRFSDDSVDSLDQGLDGIPVKDDGVMLILGDFSKGEATIRPSMRRYRSIDEDMMFRMEIVASDDGAKVITATQQDNGLD